jgi:hypothetical protein
MITGHAILRPLNYLIYRLVLQPDLNPAELATCREISAQLHGYVFGGRLMMRFTEDPGRGGIAPERCERITGIKGHSVTGQRFSSAFDLDGLFTSRGGADGVDWVHLRRGRPPTCAREAPALVRRPGSRLAGLRVRDGGVLRVWRIVLGKSGAMPGVRLRRAEAARRSRGRFLAHV